MGFLLLVPLILICFVWQNESIPVHSQQHSEGAVYIGAGVCVVFLVVLVLGLLLGRRKYFLEVVIQQWAGYVKSQPWEMPYISSVSWGQADVSAWLCCSCLPGSPAQCLGQLPAWSHHLRHHSYQLTWGLMRRCAIQSHIPFPARFLYYYPSLSCYFVPVLPNEEGRCTGFMELYPVFFHVPDVLLGGSWLGQSIWIWPHGNCGDFLHWKPLLKVP